MQLEVNGGFDLIQENPGARVDSVTTELLLYPKEDFRQQVPEFESTGKIRDNTVYFEWDTPSIEEQRFGYSAYVTTVNQRKQVRKKVPYPLTDITGYEQYTLPSEKIDSNHPEIVRKAAELAEGEDDLFKVSFKLANWVAQNVEYDLNELTTDKAQSASWVLQNGQGVCDEMTSLFVAMARSLGIPAKFVTGISYTENAQVLAALGRNWAGHGWAEVYFPTIGWVSFDITFDEYGYVDVTHIKLREGLDPGDPATRYEWLAKDVTLKPKPLDLQVTIIEEGTVRPEEIQLEQELLSSSVDIGSYNLVKGILKNTADYYAATTLHVAVPGEVEIVGTNKRTILLGPREVKETYWVLRVEPNLDPSFKYTFPSLIYSEKNVSVRDQFVAQTGEEFYTQEEINALTIEDEDKTYSRKVVTECEYPHEVNVNQEVKTTCSVKNIGHRSLEDLQFCVEGKCETIQLGTAEHHSTTVSLSTNEAGWRKISVSAINPIVEKRQSFPYLILDAAALSIAVDAPEEVRFGERFDVTLQVSKDSLAAPQNVVIQLRNDFSGKQWELEKLIQDETIVLQIDELPLQWTNTFTLHSQWEDANGEVYEHEQEFSIAGKGESLMEKVKMLLFTIVGIFL